MFGIMRVLVAALLAVGQGNGWVRERRQKLFEPILVDRVNVGTGNDNKLAACNGTSPIQRAAKREVLGEDRNKLDREERCDGDCRKIGRAHVCTTVPNAQLV